MMEKIYHFTDIGFGPEVGEKTRGGVCPKNSNRFLILRIACANKRIKVPPPHALDDKVRFKSFKPHIGFRRPGKGEYVFWHEWCFIMIVRHQVVCARKTS
jgi:hypothetical protein